MNIFFLILISAVLFFLMAPAGHEVGMDEQGGSWLEGVTVRHYAGSGQDWQLESRRAEIADNGQVTYLEDVSVDIAEGPVKIYAQKGTYWAADGGLKLEGGVRAEADGLTVTSDGVGSLEAGGQVRLTGNVVIKGRGLDVQGVDMTMQGGRVKLYSNVKAKIYL